MEVDNGVGSRVGHGTGVMSNALTWRDRSGYCGAACRGGVVPLVWTRQLTLSVGRRLAWRHRTPRGWGTDAWHAR